MRIKCKQQALNIVGSSRHAPLDSTDRGKAWAANESMIASFIFYFLEVTPCKSET